MLTIIKPLPYPIHQPNRFQPFIYEINEKYFKISGILYQILTFNIYPISALDSPILSIEGERYIFIAPVFVLICGNNIHTSEDLAPECADLHSVYHHIKRAGCVVGVIVGHVPDAYSGHALVGKPDRAVALV